MYMHNILMVYWDVGCSIGWVTFYEIDSNGNDMAMGIVKLQRYTRNYRYN